MCQMQSYIVHTGWARILNKYLVHVLNFLSNYFVFFFLFCFIVRYHCHIVLTSKFLLHQNVMNGTYSNGGDSCVCMRACVRERKRDIECERQGEQANQRARKRDHKIIVFTFRLVFMCYLVFHETKTKNEKKINLSYELQQYSIPLCTVGIAHKMWYVLV